MANPDRPGFIKSKTGGLRGELNSDAPGFANWTTVVAWRTLDYSFSNDLDGTNAAGVADLMFELLAETGAALVLVTHDPALAARADRVLIMTDGRLDADAR